MIAVFSLGATWLHALLDLSIKALALGVVARVCLWIGRARSPALRHAVWAAVLCGMLGLPLLGVLMPGINVPLLPVAASRTEDPATVATGFSEGTPAGVEIIGPVAAPPPTGVSAKPADATDSRPEPRAPWSLTAAILTGYLTGVGAAGSLRAGARRLPADRAG